MIEKKECLVGTVVIVNSKQSKWNIELGMSNNGLFSMDSTMLGEENALEILPGVKLTIIHPPKRVEGSILVKYKILGEEIEKYSYWVVFKHKVDKLFDAVK